MNYKELEHKMNAVAKDKGMSSIFRIDKGSNYGRYQIWDTTIPKTKKRNSPLVTFFGNKRTLIYDFNKLNDDNLIDLIRDFMQQLENDENERHRLGIVFKGLAKNGQSDNTMVTRGYIAYEYGVGYTTISAWLEDGLKYYSIPTPNGTQIRIKIKDLNQYLNSKKQ